MPGGKGPDRRLVKFRGTEDFALVKRGGSGPHRNDGVTWSSCQTTAQLEGGGNGKGTGKHDGGVTGVQYAYKEVDNGNWGGGESTLSIGGWLAGLGLVEIAAFGGTANIAVWTAGSALPVTVISAAGIATFSVVAGALILVGGVLYLATRPVSTHWLKISRPCSEVREDEQSPEDFLKQWYIDHPLPIDITGDGNAIDMEMK